MSTVVSKEKQQRRSIIGAFVGTAIEWYDFYIFGTAAALVFGRVFYPDIAPGAGLLASFATFWVGFVARPLGGIIFGHFGDRIGRRKSLLVTLVFMGVGTTLIGILPGYAQIGWVAPVLLVVLRAVQGLAVGGEWGGAVVLATENAKAGKQGLAGAWVQQGAPAGGIMATLIFLLVGSLDDEAFLSWGWRVPFLLSSVLLVVAFFIRRTVEETSAFEEVRKQEAVAKAPLVEIMRTAPAVMIYGVFASVLGISLAYFLNTFLLGWTTGTLGMDRSPILNILLLLSVVQFIWQPLAALIAERVGQRTVMLGGLAWSALLAVPLFLAIQSRNVVALGVMVVLQVFGSSAYYAMLANALAQAFPAKVRYTGVSTSYQLCATIFGGSTPLVAAWLLEVSGGSLWSVMGLYLTTFALTIFGVLGLLRRYPPQVQSRLNGRSKEPARPGQVETAD